MNPIDYFMLKCCAIIAVVALVNIVIRLTTIEQILSGNKKDEDKKVR